MNKGFHLIQYLILVFVATAIQSSNLLAQMKDNRIVGIVYDKETKQPIAGAKVRDLNNKKVAYTNPKGRFYLPKPTILPTEIDVQSIGSEKTKVSYNGSDTIRIYLKSKPTLQKEAVVTAQFSVEQILQNAIAKKDENKRKIKSFQGLLYSKLILELDGSLLDAASAGSTGNSISVGASLALGGSNESNPEKEKIKDFVFETFSNYKEDIESGFRSTEIIQRRQTANIPSSSNVFTISKFVNFYEDVINVINTEIQSPLSKNAFSYYKYKLLNRIDYDGKYIYEIQIIPDTKLYPTFEGTIKLLEESYDLLEVNLKTSENTSISFVEGPISYIERFEVDNQGVWYPDFLEIKANAKTDIIAGLVDFSMKLSSVSQYNNVKINEQIPDSIRYRFKNTKLTVAKLADSANSEFWNNNSLREISQKEIEIYNRIDSLVKLDTNKSETEKDNNLGLSVLPYLNVNRVENVSLGLDLDFKFFDWIKLNNRGYYSFGQKKWFGSTTLAIPLKIASYYNTELSLKVYSEPFTMAWNDKSFNKLENTISSLLTSSDYFDYLRLDGFDLKLKNKISFLNIDFFYTQRNNSYLENRSGLMLELSDDITRWGENRFLPTGRWDLLKMDLGYTGNPFGWDGFEMSANYFISQGHLKNRGNFWMYKADVNFTIPTFYTGYDNAELQIRAEIGRQTELTPFGISYRMKTRNLILSPFGNFKTAPIGVYGGNEFWEAHFEYNLTDLPWRAIGLPTYKGRGLDLLVGYSMGQFTQILKRAAIFQDYIQTDGVFQEAWVGFGRIPTLVSDFAFWNIKFAYNTGKSEAKRGAVVLGIDLGL